MNSDVHSRVKLRRNIVTSDEPLEGGQKALVALQPQLYYYRDRL